LVCFLTLGAAFRACGYSVLTHQAVVDSAWDREIEPRLRHRFPNATPEQLRKARAHAYGGCIIQDLGYYPFGNKFFSDLVHYVRSGDFVEALIAEARDLNEYAFAFGALAHYASDTVGHPVAVNPAVAMEYPKLARKFGPRVTYAENPAAHIKTEFGFDVLQVAQGNYAPEAYHSFIGFEVSKPLLERAFRATYSLELSDVFASVDLALGTYRHTVSGLIPAATRAAWILNGDELTRARPGLTRDRFIFNLTRAEYEKEWGAGYERPGIGSRVIAFLFRLVPKWGPFKGLDFHPPGPEAQRLFMSSFNETLGLYRKLLAESGANPRFLVNRDLDTGRPARPGEYPLADKTYAKLVRTLSKRGLQSIDPDLCANVLWFFDNAKMPLPGSRKERRDTREGLARLRAAPSGAAGPMQPGAAR
jgi:hypothetical protein